MVGLIQNCLGNPLNLLSANKENNNSWFSVLRIILDHVYKLLALARPSWYIYKDAWPFVYFFITDGREHEAKRQGLKEEYWVSEKQDLWRYNKPVLSPGSSKERIIKENPTVIYWGTEMADSKGRHKLHESSDRKEIGACIYCSKDDGELKDPVVIFL